MSLETPDEKADKLIAKHTIKLVLYAAVKSGADRPLYEALIKKGAKVTSLFIELLRRHFGKEDPILAQLRKEYNIGQPADNVEWASDMSPDVYAYLQSEKNEEAVDDIDKEILSLEFGIPFEVNVTPSTPFDVNGGSAGFN